MFGNKENWRSRSDFWGLSNKEAPEPLLMTENFSPSLEQSVLYLTGKQWSLGALIPKGSSTHINEFSLNELGTPSEAQGWEQDNLMHPLE